MKLQLIEKFNNKSPVLSAISLEDKKAVFLTYNNESCYELLIATENEFKSIDLGFIGVPGYIAFLKINKNF